MNSIIVCKNKIAVRSGKNMYVIIYKLIYNNNTVLSYNK